MFGGERRVHSDAGCSTRHSIRGPSKTALQNNFAKEMSTSLGEARTCRNVTFLSVPTKCQMVEVMAAATGKALDSASSLAIFAVTWKSCLISKSAESMR